MVAASDNEFGHRELTRHPDKCLHQHVKAFVGAPLPEREDAMNRISTMIKVRRFRTAGEDAMMTNPNGAASVFFAQSLVVCGQQDRDGICRQQKMSCDPACSTVKLLGLDSRICQIHRFK